MPYNHIMSGKYATININPIQHLGYGGNYDFLAELLINGLHGRIVIGLQILIGLLWSEFDFLKHKSEMSRY